MKRDKHKKANRAYLKRVFKVKTIFYPVMVLLVKSGLAPAAEVLMNRFVRFLGIRKNVHYYLKYRDYGKFFSGYYKRDKSHEREILFPMMFGAHSNFNLLNLLFSRYFSERDGINPIFYVCDSAFDICTKDGMLKSREKYPWFCHECWDGYRFIKSETGVDTVWMSSMLTEFDTLAGNEVKRIDELKSLSECTSFEFDGIQIGIFARKSVLRYFLVGNLTDSDEAIRVYKKFLLAAVKYSVAFRRILNDRPGIRYVILNNGSLVFEAIARFYCENRGITYMTYETYIGNNSLIYKKNGAVMDLNWPKEYESFLKDFFVTDTVVKQVGEFFDNLRKGVGMYAVLNKEHKPDKIDGVDRYACLFTNLNYDTAVIDRNFLFRNMEEWILSIIEYWKVERPDLTLVIRIHPGELKLVTASREFLGDRIRKAIGTNRKIIVFDADESINSYELINEMEFGMIYSSTIGLEIARAGKACLVAGLPWFRDKPFVMYPNSTGEYFSMVESLAMGRQKFIPDEDDLIRTTYFIYFNRVKRLRGIKLYTPREEPNTDLTDSTEMIRENITFFSEFRDELYRAEL